MLEAKVTGIFSYGIVTGGVNTFMLLFTVLCTEGHSCNSAIGVTWLLLDYDV